MFYKQYNYPAIPQDLKNDLINYAKEHAVNHLSERSYGWFNNTDINDLSYISSTDEYEKLYGKSGPVVFLSIPENLDSQIRNIYKNTPSMQKGFFMLQVNYDINTFPPHIDMVRNITRMYLLQAGGENVETSWYEPKDEYKHLQYKHPVNFIDNSRLNKIYSANLSTDVWYDLTVSKIHGVTNLEDYRISLALILDQPKRFN